METAAHPRFLFKPRTFGMMFVTLTPSASLWTGVVKTFRYPPTQRWLTLQTHCTSRSRPMIETTRNRGARRARPSACNLLQRSNPPVRKSTPRCTRTNPTGSFMVFAMECDSLWFSWSSNSPHVLGSRRSRDRTQRKNLIQQFVRGRSRLSNQRFVYVPALPTSRGTTLT